MASLIVSPATINVTDKSQNTVTINFTSDEALTDVKLSTDGGNTYKDKISMTQNSATFDISNMSNNTYSCKLKGFYEESNIPDIPDIPNPEPPSAITGIKTEPSSVSVEVGKTANIQVLFGDDVINKSIEYMSSNYSIATISDNGDYTYKVTGNTEGQATIRFRTSDGKYETSCDVTVTSSNGGNNSGSGLGNEYEMSCTSEYILDKMYPMGQAHEAIPSGDITGWKYNTRWENQDRPYAMSHSCGQYGCPDTGPFQALGCWANIYRVEGTSFTQNTGVEMRDIKVYGWYNGSWELVQHLPVPSGNFYQESFNGDANQYFSDSVKQSSTSKTIILREANKINSENCMYHPFSDIKKFDTKYEYIYTCIDLRKVKWDESGIDDRDNTHYCSNCGGDWWLAEGLMFHDSWQHNKGVCQPKMIKITNEWRRFSMTTVPQGWTKGFPK